MNSWQFRITTITDTIKNIYVTKKKKKKKAFFSLPHTSGSNSFPLLRMLTRYDSNAEEGQEPLQEIRGRQNEQVSYKPPFKSHIYF